MAIARILAALYLPDRIPDLVVRSTSIVTAMTDNDDFPSPPALGPISAHIKELHDAHVLTQTRTHGTFEARDTCRVVVVKDMNVLLGHVQTTADLNPVRAAEIITGAGMFVRGKGGARKQTFSAERGDVSGQAFVYAPVIDRSASYEWQTSTNLVDWQALPSTRQASTTVFGLAPLVMHHFRFRTVTWVGVSDWSDPVSLLVL